METDDRYVGLGLLCTFLGSLLRTVRRQFILTPPKGIRLRSLYPVLMIGLMANNLLPLRIGELVRARLLGREETTKQSLAFASVIAERVLDGLTLIFFLIMVSLAFPLPAWGQQMQYLSLVLFGTALVALVFPVFREDWAVPVVSFLLSLLPSTVAARPHDMFSSFTSGIGALRDARRV